MILIFCHIFIVYHAESNYHLVGKDDFVTIVGRIEKVVYLLIKPL